MNNWKNRNLKY